jgi:recombination protein RecT
MNAPAKVSQVASPINVFRHELHRQETQFAAALPAHIPVERFTRVVVTAVQNNPKLLQCDRRSLWNACMKAAQDGLLPDGRESAIVPSGKQASYRPMIAGIRKKVRNSGEIATWDVHAVHEKDKFSFALGDTPFIAHEPSLEDDPGRTIAVYSIATLKSGEKSRDVMSMAAVRRIRDRSDAYKAWKAGKIPPTPWNTDEDEMAKKTVARRHSKVLPMSSDLDDLMRNDDDLYHTRGTSTEGVVADRPKSLGGKLDALANLSGNDEAEVTDVTPADDNDGEIIDINEDGEVIERESDGDENEAPAATEQESQPATVSSFADAAATEGAEVVREGPASDTSAPPTDKKDDSPKTDAEYRVFAAAWIAATPDREERLARWSREKPMRNKANVTPETRDMLEAAVKAKKAT